MTEPPASLASGIADRYTIERELGQGGMATVYLAEDIRHHRKVAIKVLHPELSAVIGPERFLKEIELTASLQHPHILPLFDSGNADGLLYYVMPYVDGETLRRRLEREQQLPIAEALRIAADVADALEYAHKRGVVHRDIKPENILLHEGRPLVADFGIALAVQQAGGARMTQTGMSLGTPQYMAPEQAMGDKHVDHRADIYALGAVTYEMLTAEPPFTGPNSQAIVAKVLTTDPTPPVLKRRSIPPHVEAAILVALEKMPADRFGSAAEFAAAVRADDGASIRRPAHAPAARSEVRWHARLRDPVPMALLGIALAMTAVAAAGWLRPRGDDVAAVVRFSLPLPPGIGNLGARFAFSRDGRTLAYAELTPTGSAVRIRHLDRTESTVVPNTEGAVSQAFSPTGDRLAFVTSSHELKVLALSGAAPVTVARNVDGYTGVDWGPDGYLYFISRDSAVVSRVDPAGGLVEHLGTLEESNLPVGFTFHRFPRVTSDGRAVLFNIYRGPGREGDIGVVDLHARTTTLIIPGATALGLRWGQLLYVTRDGTLWAAPFSTRRLAITGAPVALVPGIQVSDEGLAHAAVSEDGTLAYVPSVPPVSELVWISRDGTEAPVDPSLRMGFDALAISPDGSRIAMSAVATDGAGAVWIYEVAQQTISRFSHDGALNFRPVWTPDGSSIVYASDRGSETGARALWIRRADGSDTARLLVGSPRHAQEVSWPRDGDLVAYREGYDDSGMFRDIRYFRAGGDTTTYPFRATRADELNPTLSADGRWMAYVSNQSGRDEVYVTPFPGPGASVQLSNGGGTGPRWARSGRELFYRATDGQLMVMDVVTSPELSITRRRALFRTDAYRFDRQYPSYDVSPDGQRFLFIKPPSSVGLEVVYGWGSEVAPRLRGRESR